MTPAVCLLTAVLLAGPRPDSPAPPPADWVELLEDVASAETVVFQVKDDGGRTMDCLKVFQAGDDGNSGGYFGVYHTREDGRFVAHLARSFDLRRWEHVVALDEHASQPTVARCGGGWLLAYEKDRPGSCWIRLRYHETLEELLGGRHRREIDLPRTLAPTAEGTPSVESIEWGNGDPAASQMTLRFHYFQKVRVDQLAAGTLTNFERWTAAPLDEVNAAFRRGGWRGNLGDRDRFAWRGETYFLQEAQRIGGDWSSWRICLCDGDGLPLRTLSMRTPGGSTAFANPNVTSVVDGEGRRKLVVTLFVPTEGNAPSEVGTLLYVVDPSARLAAAAAARGERRSPASQPRGGG